MKKYQEQVYLFFIFSLFLFLVLYRIQDCRILIDEFFSINIAQRPLSDIWSLAPHPGKFYWNTSPPIYETILHFFWDVSGKNILLPRMLSVFFQLTALYFLYRLTKLLFDRATGFIAVLLAALNVSYIFYGKMIRCYAFLNALTIISLYIFFRMVKRNSLSNKHLLALLAVNTAILYTFYFGALTIGLEFLFLLFFFRGRQRLVITCCLGAAFLFFIPWIGHATRDILFEPAINVAPADKVKDVLAVFRVIYLRFSEGRFFDKVVFIFYGCILLAVLTGILRRMWLKREKAVYPAALLLFLFLPVFVVNEMTKSSPELSRVRYSFVFIFPIFMLTAYFIKRLRRLPAAIVFLIAVFLSLRSLFVFQRASTERFWPAEIAVLAEEAKKFPLANGEKAIIEIETDLYMPIFVYYFYGPQMFRSVSYPNLWSGARELADWSGTYKITYNIACLNKHFLRSVDYLKQADWVFLFYSKWHPECWFPSFRQVYVDKLKVYGLENSLESIEKKYTNSFFLEIFKVKKIGAAE